MAEKVTPQAEKPAAPAKAPRKRSRSTKGSAPAAKAAGKGKEYLVLHRLHHNDQELHPGDKVQFGSWPVRTTLEKGKFVTEYASQDVVDAHVAELVANGVVALNDKDAKAKLEAADAAREAAVRKAG